jgi:hypothetical protein
MNMPDLDGLSLSWTLLGADNKLLDVIASRWPQVSSRLDHHRWRSSFDVPDEAHPWVALISNHARNFCRSSLLARD